MGKVEEVIRRQMKLFTEMMLSKEALPLLVVAQIPTDELVLLTLKSKKDLEEAETALMIALDYVRKMRAAGGN